MLVNALPCFLSSLVFLFHLLCGKSNFLRSRVRILFIRDLCQMSLSSSFDWFTFQCPSFVFHLPVICRDFEVLLTVHKTCGTFNVFLWDVTMSMKTTNSVEVETEDETEVETASLPRITSIFLRELHLATTTISRLSARLHLPFLIPLLHPLHGVDVVTLFAVVKSYRLKLSNLERSSLNAITPKTAVFKIILTVIAILLIIVMILLTIVMMTLTVFVIILRVVRITVDQVFELRRAWRISCIWSVHFRFREYGT